jgi:hypothetical protein
LPPLLIRLHFRYIKWHSRSRPKSTKVKTASKGMLESLRNNTVYSFFITLPTTE